MNPVVLSRQLRSMEEENVQCLALKKAADDYSAGYERRLKQFKAEMEAMKTVSFLESVGGLDEWEEEENPSDTLETNEPASDASLEGDVEAAVRAVVELAEEGRAKGAMRERRKRWRRVIESSDDEEEEETEEKKKCLEIIIELQQFKEVKRDTNLRN